MEMVIKYHHHQRKAMSEMRWDEVAVNRCISLEGSYDDTLYVLGTYVGMGKLLVCSLKSYLIIWEFKEMTLESIFAITQTK